MIAIIDYGMGNIHSVNKALSACGGNTIVTNDALKISKCEKLVLPGVGAFSDAMEELKKRNLIPAINAHLKAKKAFLGICLGMQLLFEESEEAEGVGGLAVFKGRVKRFSKTSGLKVPHMGWNTLNVACDMSHVACDLLKWIKSGDYVYFCHSYYPEPAEPGVVAATCDYGREFAAVVASGNIYGVQFHPEKSQRVGLKMMENFVKLC